MMCASYRVYNNVGRNKTVQAVAQDGRFRHRISLSETPYFAPAQ